MLDRVCRERWRDGRRPGLGRLPSEEAAEDAGTAAGDDAPAQAAADSTAARPRAAIARTGIDGRAERHGARTPGSCAPVPMPQSAHGA